MIALYTFCNPSLISRTSRGGHEFSGRVGLDERKPAVILGRRPAGRPQFSFVMRRSGWGRNDSPVIHGAGACTEPDLVLYNRRQREPHPGGGWLVNFGISMAVTRLQRAEGVPTERMSPELVLVSPGPRGERACLAVRLSVGSLPAAAAAPGNRRCGPGTTPRTPDGQACSPVCLDRDVPRSRRRRQHPAGPGRPDPRSRRFLAGRVPAPQPRLLRAPNAHHAASRQGGSDVARGVRWTGRVDPSRQSGCRRRRDLGQPASPVRDRSAKAHDHSVRGHLQMCRAFDVDKHRHSIRRHIRRLTTVRWSRSSDDLARGKGRCRAQRPWDIPGAARGVRHGPGDVQGPRRQAIAAARPVSGATRNRRYATWTPMLIEPV